MKLKFKLTLPGANRGPEPAVECVLSDPRWNDKLAELGSNAGVGPAAGELRELLGHLARLDRSLLNDFMEVI